MKTENLIILSIQWENSMKSEIKKNRYKNDIKKNIKGKWSEVRWEVETHISTSIQYNWMEWNYEH